MKHMHTCMDCIKVATRDTIYWWISVELQFFVCIYVCILCFIYTKYMTALCT